MSSQGSFNPFAPNEIKYLSHITKLTQFGHYVPNIISSTHLYFFICVRVARAPTLGIWLLSGWQAEWLTRARVSSVYVQLCWWLADWLAPLRVRAYVRCSCRFTKVKRFSKTF